MNLTDINWFFDNQTQWNYSVMTWVNGTSFPGHVDVQVQGMDLLISFQAVMTVLLLILVWLTIRNRRL
jgi:hypothetical protein